MPQRPSYEELQERVRELERRLHAEEAGRTPQDSDIIHYRTLFENVPIPLWEEDFTEVFRYFEELKEQGISDFRHYFNNNREAVAQCARLVKVVHVNNAAVKMHEAGNRDELLGNLDKIFTESSIDSFRDEIIALANGERELEIEGEVKTLSGEIRYIFLKLITYSKSPDRVMVLISTIDITTRKEAEQLLKASEEKYRLLVENQSDLVVKVDLHGSFLYVSPSYCRTFGKQEHELLGQTFLPLVHPDDKEATEEAMQHLFTPPYRAFIEQRAMTVDGWRWIAWSDTAVLDEAGEVREIIGVGRDINQQKHAEESLVNSERRFREIIEDVSEIAIQGYNEQRQVIFWNQASEKLYGYSRQEAMGRKIEELIIPEEMRETVKADIERWLDQGEKIPSGPLILRSKTGEEVPVYSSHVLLESSRAKELFCVDIDLSPIEKAEKAVKASEQLLSRINHCFLNFTPAPLDNINQLVELAGTQCNAAWAVYNRLADGALHTVCSWNTPPEFGPEAGEAGRLCRKTIIEGAEEPVVVSTPSAFPPDPDSTPEVNEIHTFVGKAVRFAGKSRGSLCVVFYEEVIPNANDKRMLGILAAAIGIEEERLTAQRETARAQHYAAEREKQALVGKIAGKMAHDFNNVLGAIMGNAELALLDSREPRSRQTLQLIVDQTLKGRNLTRNLVAFAKDQEPKQEFFSVNDKIDLVLSLLKKDLQDIAVGKEWSPGLPEMLADPGMIEHCLVNLLQNAIHAVSKCDAPRIRLRTSQRDEQICIHIEDNGCGIPARYLERIFEPAFTLKGGGDTTGAYAPGIKGTGYGMANVKKYIEQHHGTIEIASKERHGTSVTLCFPEVKTSLSPEEVKEIVARGVVSERRILVVEDEQAIADVQYRILSQPPCSHEVDMAADGATAIALIDRNDYDLISLDYVLPGTISGIDVYTHLRRQNTATPVLFISGNLSFLESIRKLKEDDPRVDHVAKPCQNKEYIDSICNLLQGN